MIPDDIRRFILTSVPSIPYLEAALLLRRNREGSWDAFSLAGALYVAPPRAAELLRALTGAGVATFDPERQTYTYAPHDDVLRDSLERLAELYRIKTIEITQLVHDTTQRSAHRFASAFDLRKDSAACGGVRADPGCHPGKEPQASLARSADSRAQRKDRP